MSYSNMKPINAEVHQHLVDWVKRGGVLIYSGRDDDPYQSVMEWWDTKGNKFKAPSEHLFKLLGIHPTVGKERYKVGKGAVYILRENPKEFVMQQNNDEGYLKAVRSAYEQDARSGKLITKNNFYLERGPYDIISVMDENPDSKPYVVKGPVIDLFNPDLPVLGEKTVTPGEQSLLYVVNRVADKSRPKVLASAARIYDEKMNAKSYSFVTKSPVNTLNSSRVLLPSKPGKITVTDSSGQTVSDVKSSWDTSSHTLYLGFPNSPDGVKVVVEW
jgi:hypothetical protein